MIDREQHTGATSDRSLVGGARLARVRVGSSRTVRRALRSRTLAWTGALVVATMVTSTWSAAQRSRSEWGRTVPVVVATRVVGAGEPVDATSFELDEWPARLVPDGSVRSLPSDARLRVSLSPGEVLLQQRLARASTGSTGAVLGGDQVAVITPLGEPNASLEPGDMVDVYAPSAADTGGELVPSLRVRRVTRRAEVLSVHADGVTLIVDREEAAAVAAAALGGLVSIAVVG